MEQTKIMTDTATDTATDTDTAVPEDVTPATKPEPTKPEPLRIRYRIRFAKAGLLRWISHRDLASLWERLLRRAALKLSMTEGFHPKPRVAFPSALALGVESQDDGNLGCRRFANPLTERQPTRANDQMC